MFKFNREKLIGSPHSRVYNKDNSIVKASNFNTSTNLINPDYQTGVLEDFLDDTSNISLNNLYREIYLYDSVSGPTVDLMSNLPWSGYNLTGISDPKILKIFENSLSELDLVSLLIQSSVSYLVIGQLIGSLIFNEKKGIFTDVVMHNPDECEVSPIPLRGYDPKIDLRVSQEMKKFLRSTDPRDMEAKKELSPEMTSKLLKNNSVPLEPLNTMYLARSFVPGINCISFYSRILPIWLVEKALLRGTIIGSWRRQRSILHIMVDDEDWDPTDDQLEAVSSMFANADQDPQGAVVVSRKGLVSNELRNGSDFWKITDEYDTLSAMKMRAMGISEAFLSGDAAYNTMEISLSVFMENLKVYREFLTRSIVYDKIFLLTSKYHGFKKRTTAELKHNIRLSSNSDKRKAVLESKKFPIFGKKSLADAYDYIIPGIQWDKNLTARSDRDYMDLLTEAEEKGVPVTVTDYAVAAGVDIKRNLESTEDDIKTREEIKLYRDELKRKNLTSEDLSSNELQGEDERGGDLFSKKIPKESILSNEQAEKLFKLNQEKVLKKSNNNLIKEIDNSNKKLIKNLDKNNKHQTRELIKYINKNPIILSGAENGKS